MDDRELERLAKRLGSRASQEIDVDRVANRVVTRLRGEGHRERTLFANKRSVRWIAQIAAVLVLLVTGSIILRNGGVTERAPGFAVPMALDDLSESELSDVLDSLTFAGPVQHVGRGGIDDLSDAELEQLLAMMES